MLDLFTSDPYETLGVDKDADLATIRKAHRKLVLQCHPDKLRDENREEGTRRFGEVTKAYELLVDETRRQRYDAGVKLAKWRLESQVTGRNELRQTGRTNEVPLPREYLGNAWFHQDADRIRRDRYDPFYSYSHERRARRRERSVKSVLDYRFFFSPFGSKERRERFERRRRERERRERERRGTEGIRSLEQYEKYRRQYEIWEQQRLRFLGLPLSIPKRLAKKSAAGILALEGFVNGNFVCTNPDTGAQANLIALSFAESIGLHLINREPELQVGFRMANGNMIYSIGQVNAQWCFKKGSSESYDISFYVFAECCFDVLIGDPFLRATQTMSTNEHRLSWVPRPKWALYVRRVNLLGCPSQQMKGKLSGEEVFALADTGAEGGNLVSYDYAQRRGWLASDLSGERNLLQFPDGSQSRTEGQVRKVWRYHGTLSSELSLQCHGTTSPLSSLIATVEFFHKPPKRLKEALLTPNCEQAHLDMRRKSLLCLMSCTIYHST